MEPGELRCTLQLVRDRPKYAGAEDLTGWFLRDGAGFGRFEIRRAKGERTLKLVDMVERCSLVTVNCDPLFEFVGDVNMRLSAKNTDERRRSMFIGEDSYTWEMGPAGAMLLKQDASDPNVLAVYKPNSGNRGYNLEIWAPRMGDTFHPCIVASVIFSLESNILFVDEDPDEHTNSPGTNSLTR